MAEVKSLAEKREAKNAYMRRFYAKRKARLAELKAGRSCGKCGFSDPRALDFHHRDPSLKEFQVSTKAWQTSWKRLTDEAAKCDILCANCHRIEHSVLDPTNGF